MDAKLQTLLEWRRGYFDERKIVASPEFSAEQENFVEACRREYVKRRRDYLERRRHERTAAALAEAQAEVARLRAANAKQYGALALIVNAAAVYESSVPPPVSDYYRGAIDGRNEAARIARAALEPAPAGEA